MNYRKGCLIEAFDNGEIDVLIHGANCFNTMGAGVALHLKNRWPEVFEVDKNKSVKGDKGKLGGTTRVWVDRKCGSAGLVINAYTQYKYGRGVHCDYDAITEVFTTIKEFHHNFGSIGIPKIGAGLAGGNWGLIEHLIDSLEIDNLYCYTLE